MQSRIFQRVRSRGKGFVSMLLSVLFLLPAFQTTANDRELLRTNRSKPYVFVLLDTSASMNSAIDGSWTHAGGDDPRSRLYQAKEALYEAFRGVDDVHFGFAAFNQDAVQVSGKHYLYFVADHPDNETALASNPVDYPKIEPGNVVEAPGFDADGAPFGVDVEIDGDLITFGRYSTTIGGSCADPIIDREALNRFPKLGADGSETAVTWFRTTNPSRTYMIKWSLQSGTLGDAEIDVSVSITQVWNCSSIPLSPDWSQKLDLTLWRDFLMWDDPSPSVETAGGYWNWRDVRGSYACGDSKPFSGGGWEGNYDTGDPFDFEGLDHPQEVAEGTVDTFCLDPEDPNTCTNSLREATKADPAGFSELDHGDMLPLHWDFDRQNAFLERINPGGGFGQARYFDDAVDPITGVLPPVANFSRSPLIAAGDSPLGFALNDFRCWYLGDPSDERCRNSTGAARYRDGWENIAERFDPEWECRKPYLLVVTDGEDNCPDEAPSAVVDDLFSESGIRTWAIHLGPGELNLVPPGKGREANVESREELLDELRAILGEIREEERGFASAATPSVQADVADSIYLTQFTPLQDDAVWPGQVHAFLKPLPIDDSHDPPVPDRDHKRRLWDAGETIRDEQAPTEASLPGASSSLLGGPYYSDEDLRLGLLRTQRRAYYGIENSEFSKNRVPQHRGFFSPQATPPPGSLLTEGDVRRDLWPTLGFSLPSPTLFNLDEDSLKNLHPGPTTKLHDLFKETFVVKTTQIGAPPDEEEISYVLGDVFHSHPKVIGKPSDGRFLNDSTNFPGYEEFYRQHARRRKVLVVGSNDGMLHFIDAGVYRADDPLGDPFGGEFDHGTGTEIAAFIPRAVLPSFVARVESSDHQWGVDGAPIASDVRIDTLHTGDPSESDREWRTIVVGGLRRGGRSVYALDVTLPDPIVYKNDGKEKGWVPTTFDDPASDFTDRKRVFGGGVTPDCIDGVGVARGASGEVKNCDGLERPYPFPLWEFTDPDLQQTWSTPAIAAVRVLTDQDSPEKSCRDLAGNPIPCRCVDANGSSVYCAPKYVAIFGSGMHTSLQLDTGAPSESDPYLYMVDVETGRLLYKRSLGAGLGGSAAAAPAVIDVDRDGFADRIYIGTTLGSLFRIDLDEPAALETCFSLGQAEECVDDPSTWRPNVIFQTQDSRPIFFPPEVIFSAELGRFVLAFGTGNRENLWDAKEDQRFYAFVDDYDLDPTVRTVDDLTLLTNQVSSPGTDYLHDRSLEYGRRGYYLELGRSSPEDPGCPDFCDFNPARERVVGPATAISGLLSFSTFIPHTEVEASGLDSARTCASRGVGRNYVMLFDNGDAIIAPNGQSEPQRSRSVDALVGEPFIEQGQTDNPCDPTVEDCGTELCEGVEDVAEVLKNEIFPPTCKFGNYRFNLSTIRADTGVECIAAVPICVIEKNWQEATGSLEEYDPSEGL